MLQSYYILVIFNTIIKILNHIYFPRCCIIAFIGKVTTLSIFAPKCRKMQTCYISKRVFWKKHNGTSFMQIGLWIRSYGHLNIYDVGDINSVNLKNKSGSILIPKECMCRLRNIAMCDYQQCVTTGQTDTWTDRHWSKWSPCAALLRRRHKNEVVYRFLL